MAQPTTTASLILAEQKSEPVGPSGIQIPLVVDLDGTLVKTDLLVESLVTLLKDQPLCFCALPAWLLRGKAAFKREVAARTKLDAGLMPYRTELVEYLRAQRAQGRPIVLATASNERLAHQVADHLQLFDSVWASDARVNLSGDRKRKCLVSHFGEKGFDYAGDESRDSEVWSSARKAILVNPSRKLLRDVTRVAEIQCVFQERGAGFAEYWHALRPQQWLKNVLVFVPLFAAHRFFEPALLGKCLLAFLAFCCCASSGYAFNDLLDLTADRHHPQKRLRPFAAGRLPLSYALAMIPAL